MRISARNVFLGKVKEVRKGAVSQFSYGGEKATSLAAFADGG
jgi:hypothetical protein